MDAGKRGIAMAYVRKTKDVWVVEGDYGYGYEYLTASEDRAEARDDLRAYRENERGVSFRLRKTRERITEA